VNNNNIDQMKKERNGYMKKQTVDFGTYALFALLVDSFEIILGVKKSVRKSVSSFMKAYKKEVTDTMDVLEWLQLVEVDTKKAIGFRPTPAFAELLVKQPDQSTSSANQYFSEMCAEVFFCEGIEFVPEHLGEVLLRLGLANISQNDHYRETEEFYRLCRKRDKKKNANVDLQKTLR
jgi:hypothetical protein